MTRGFAIGKFLPFHRGHRHLLETASARCDQLTVGVVTSEWHEIPAEVRVGWIRTSLPHAEVIVIDQDAESLDDWDTPGWARVTIEALGGRAPDVVFSSEEYGRPWAEAMGCRHELVDIERNTVPISGTAVRADPLANLEFLDPHVRAWFVKRVHVVGAESTGKSTLCADLAAHYGVPFLEEFGRLYTEAQPEPLRYRWSAEDMRTIARTQLRFEEDMAQWVGPLLVADTNCFTTQLFCELYLDRPDPEVGELANRQAAQTDLWLLCDLTTPFTQDGTGMRKREGRRGMDIAYREAAEHYGIKLVELSGDRADRLNAATAAIDQLLAAAADRVAVAS